MVVARGGHGEWESGVFRLQLVTFCESKSLPAHVVYNCFKFTKEEFVPRKKGCVLLLDNLAPFHSRRTMVNFAT